MPESKSFSVVLSHTSKTIISVAYNEKLAERIRESLVPIKMMKEKEMMGGLTFMVNDKIKGERICFMSNWGTQ